MTKNKTAICTPTKTRAEFESILMELDGVGVKWVSGNSPIGGGSYYNRHDIVFLVYGRNGLSSLLWASRNNSDWKQLPRADFIAAIKRDFGKEKPEMDYNKMLKKDLIAELKAILVDNAEIKAKWIEQDEANNKLFGECANLKDINRELLGDTKQLEKTNAEQAETIARLKTEAEFCLSANSLFKENEELLESKCDAAEKENIRIKRLAAQMLCPDVLEGK